MIGSKIAENILDTKGTKYTYWFNSLDKWTFTLKWSANLLFSVSVSCKY